MKLNEHHINIVKKTKQSIAITIHGFQCISYDFKLFVFSYLHSFYVIGLIYIDFCVFF